MTRARVVIWFFTAVWILSLVAAFLPVLKGERPSVVFLGSGVVWLVIAIATAKRNRAAKKIPPAA